MITTPRPTEIEERAPCACSATLPECPSCKAFRGQELATKYLHREQEDAPQEDAGMPPEPAPIREPPPPELVRLYAQLSQAVKDRNRLNAAWHNAANRVLRLRHEMKRLQQALYDKRRPR
jgi:hypothetical protein